MKVSKNLHGAAFSAPDESGFVDESPKPGAVGPKNGRTAAGKSDPPPPERPGFWHSAWSLVKLAVGVAIVVGAAGSVAWGAHRYALSSPRFSIKKLEVSGIKRRTDDQILRLGNVKLGDNVFAVDTNQVEQKLLTDPWIKQVKVTRVLPATLRIELEEREVGALASIGDQLYLITRAGEPFKPVEEGDPFDLPIVTGIDTDQIARDRERAIERFTIALEILRHWERIPASRVYPAQEIHLGAGGDAVLSVGKAGVTLHLGHGPWRKKLLMAERVLGQLEKKGKTPAIVFADNQAHPERVVVRLR